MMNDILQSYAPRLAALPGEVSVFGKDLITGETCAYQADLPLVAASVIKIPILIEAFRQARDGLLSMEETFAIRPEQKVPSCGALTYLHDGLQVTLRDLCVLMIILSDNTATNLLIQRLGIQQINDTLRRLGCSQTTLRRKLYDAEASRRGIQNHITAREIGSLLEKMYRGECVSPEADAQMLAILKDQRLNGKIPFFLHGLGVTVAHKTGEDDGITHDVGIVYADHPMILCFASEHTDVPAFERLMQDAALSFYRQKKFLE
ncbi:MAG: serine hydrolase [Clostridia bacterium]|nr:serine hydrolase [Clostridia bacterium]